MPQLSDCPHSVNDFPEVPGRLGLILTLLGRNLHPQDIALRTGVSYSYVRAVKSRFSSPDHETFERHSKGGRYRGGIAFPFIPRRTRPRLGYRSRPTGQPPDDLRRLAELLWQWRSEGRYAGC